MHARAVLGWCRNALGQLLSPPLCPACDAPCAEHSFCGSCALELRPFDAPITAGALRVHAGVHFDGSVRAALHKFKYHGRADLAPSLAELCRARLTAQPLPTAALWVPVPLHPRRLAERGYNQAQLLARLWAEHCDGKAAPLALRRRVDTAQQAEQSRRQRFDNVADAFEPRKPAQLEGRSAILVDDVVTTGATLSACREALERAGAHVVGIVTVAAATD